jgi:hypothetical protein
VGLAPSVLTVNGSFDAEFGNFASFRIFVESAVASALAEAPEPDVARDLFFDFDVETFGQVFHESVFVVVPGVGEHLNSLVFEISDLGL